MMQLTADHVDDLLCKQNSYFAEGHTLSYNFRLLQLKKLKNAIRQNEKALEQALAEDLGKSRTESYISEIGFVLSGITHTIKHLRQWMKPVRVKAPMTVFASKCRVIKQPYGSALIIGPYNYPFQLLLEPLVAAISAGNCAVLSPSELTPHVSDCIRNMISGCFPPQYIFCAEGGIENNTVLLQSRFDTIFFTGSANVGKIVMKFAAEHLTPVTLELGGKSPVIIDETAKLAAACERIVWGKFLNAGQTCVAPDYVFVHQSVFTKFIDMLKETIVRFYGKDIRNNPDYGRLVNTRHTERLIKILRHDRAGIVYGGNAVADIRFIEPTILCPEDIENSACMQEEIFGPLLPVFSYTDIRTPLAYITAHEKPLALYIFSESRKTIENIIKNTASGGVAVNDTISHIIVHDLPFGGIGQSGMGRYHGESGFIAFSNQRSVLNRSTRYSVKAAYPPFTDKKYSMIRRFMK